MGILMAYGPTYRAHPYQHAQPAGPTFQGMPMAVAIKHQFMHTSTWPDSRLMILGTRNNEPVVQFHHKQGEASAWHGSWQMRDKELWIWWNYTVCESNVRLHPMVYTIIVRTDSYRRGHSDWIEVLTPVR